MKRRTNCSSAYIGYLGYTALETDLLFFMVCDTIFLTQAKDLSMAQVSLLTFLSLVFSLLIQYPLLKWIGTVGSQRAVRGGSLAFLLSAVCITFAPNYAVILLGGFLKCIGHTLGAVGAVILKNRLSREGSEDQYVVCQSDANGLTALVMFVTAISCGALFRRNDYYPMYVSILCSLAGVGVTYWFSRDYAAAEEIRLSAAAESPSEKQFFFRCRKEAVILFISFGVFTALTGVGLSYAKLHLQAVLSGWGSDYAVMLLSFTAAVLYLLRFLSNLLMRSAYRRVGNRTLIVVSGLLLTGMLLQLIPRISHFRNPAFVLCAGYLLLAFVRDPYITLIQNIALAEADPCRQQSMLIKLNSVKKLGALILSAVATLLMYQFTSYAVMLLMTLAAAVNLVLCIRIIKKSQVGKS